MKHVRRMHCFECTKGLVNEVLAVVIGKLLGPDNAVHVCLHELLPKVLDVRLLIQHSVSYLDQVDLGKCFQAARFLDIKDGNDVLVVEVSQELHFSKCAQAEHGVIEGCDFLDCDLLARRFVNGRATWLVSERIDKSIENSVTKLRHTRLPQRHLECRTVQRR